MGRFRGGRVIPEGLPRLPGYMTCAEAAVQLNITPARISQMVKAGRFGQPFRIGTTIVLQTEAVQKEYDYRLANPQRFGGLAERSIPQEYHPVKIPDMDESLKEAASAFLSKDG